MPIIEKKAKELQEAPFTEPDSFLHAYIDEIRKREKLGNMGNYRCVEQHTYPYYQLTYYQHLATLQSHVELLASRHGDDFHCT